MVDVKYTAKKVELIANRAKRHVVVSKCFVGDSIQIKCPGEDEYKSYKCIKRSSNGHYRFKCEETGKIETYEPSKMKKAKKNYEIMEKIDFIVQLVNENKSAHEILEKFNQGTDNMDIIELIVLVDWLMYHNKVNQENNVLGLRPIPEKIMCLKCNKLYDKIPRKKCDCGNSTFVKGEVKIVDNKVTCACGSQSFKIIDFKEQIQAWKRTDECVVCNRIVFTKGVTSI